MDADKKYMLKPLRVWNLFKGESKEKYIFLVEFTLNKTLVFKENKLSR